MIAIWGCSDTLTSCKQPGDYNSVKPDQTPELEIHAPVHVDDLLTF